MIYLLEIIHNNIINIFQENVNMIAQSKFEVSILHVAAKVQGEGEGHFTPPKFSIPQTLIFA